MQLGTKHPLVIYICSNEGPCRVLRGDDNEIARIHMDALCQFCLKLAKWFMRKIFFSLLIQRYSIIMTLRKCVIGTVSQVSNVTH